MKKFSFKYSPFLYFLIIVVLVSSLAGLIGNIYNVVCFISNSLRVVLYSITAVLCAFIFVFDLSILVYGCYTLSDEFLTAHFGFFKTKMKVNDITEICLFKKTNKLVAYFSDGNFTVIIIPPKNYDDFIKSLREKNAQIVYEGKVEDDIIK